MLLLNYYNFTNTNTPSNSTSGVNNIGSSISPNVTINPTSTQQFMLLTAAVLEQTNVLTSGNVFLFEQDSVENIIDGGAGGANPIITGSQTINFNSSSIVTWLALGVLIDPAPTPSGGILSDPDNASLGITSSSTNNMIFNFTVNQIIPPLDYQRNPELNNLMIRTLPTLI